MPVISPGRGTALIVFSSCCFATSGPLAKAAMDAGLSPQQVAGMRIWVAAAVLLAGVALVRPRLLVVRRKDIPVLVGYGLLGVGIVQLLYFVTVSRLPVGVAMLLEYTSPVLVTVWVRVIRRTVLPRAVWLGVALALVGLVLVARVWQGGSLDTVGVLAGLGAAACSAAYFLLGERGLATGHPVGLVTWGLVIASVTMMVVCPPWTIPVRLFGTRAQLGPLHPPTWAVLLVIALLATVVAYLAGMAGLRHLPSSVVSVLSLLEPVVSTLLAWALLSQALTVIQLAGGALLLAGAMVVRLTSQPRPTQPQPTEPTAEPLPVTEPRLATDTTVRPG